MAFQDFYRDEQDQRIHLAILIPILAAPESNQALGVLALRIDPASYLYPFISRWPTPSDTAEALLIRREGNEALFLSELRFKKNAALTLRIPLAGRDVPAVKAALGQEGVVEGTDYRGVPVIADVRAVPGSPWFLIARMDASEVYAPPRQRMWATILLIGILLAGTGAGIGSVWRQQQAGFYREKYRAAEALRDSETRWASVIDSAMDAIISVDGRMRIVLFNAAAERIFGYRVSEVLGQPLDRFIPPQLRDQHRRHIEEFARAGVPGRPMTERGQLSGVRADGEVFPIEASISQVSSGGEKLFTVILRDVSERRRAEEKISALSTDLERRVQERTQALVEANNELESFSYSVSHDLLAPARHIQGYVELLTAACDGQLSEKALHYLKTISDASAEMGQLITDLLSFLRTGRVEVRETSIPLGQVVQDCVRDLELATRERRIEWNVAPLPTVLGDPSLLKQVLANLLGNAVKYTRPRDPARIEVGCAGREDGRAVLFVRDNGVGFDPQYVHKLFNVFQRLHQAEEFEGTGIGLATAARIIARHGGRVWAEGALNEGATFCFTLKLAPSEGPQGLRAEGTADEAAEAHPLRG